MNNKYEKIAIDLLRRYSIQVRNYRKKTTGRAYIKTREIEVPHPKTRVSLLVFCHEVAHIIYGEIKPKYYSEFLAEKWAMSYVRKMGIRVPHSYIQRAKKYILFKIKQADKRGRKKGIPKIVTDFINIKGRDKFTRGRKLGVKKGE